MTLEEQLRQIGEKLEAALDEKLRPREQPEDISAIVQEAAMTFLDTVAVCQTGTLVHVVEDKVNDSGYAMLVVKIPDGACTRAAAKVIEESDDRELAMLAVMQTALETNRALAMIQGMRELYGLGKGDDIRQE